jgi:TonB system transport protein ExbD (group 1)
MGAKLGKGAAGPGGFAANSDINVTPFVDIMLVLLIIFMVAAPLATVNTKVDLPPTNAQPTPPDENNKPLFVSLQQDGTVYVGDVQLASMSELMGELDRQVPHDVRTEKTVYIRADLDVAYKGVMDLMNVLRDAGLKKIGLVGESTTG